MVNGLVKSVSWRTSMEVRVIFKDSKVTMRPAKGLPLEKLSWWR
jgi:hypothetical protein